MKNEIEIEIVGGDHEHTLGMSQTRHGLGITYKTAPLMPVFESMISKRAYEACEFSLSNYVMMRDRGEDWIVAIPVFPQRSFRHSNVYVRRDSGIDHPAKLAGRRVGVHEYSMTLAVWIRGIFSEQYDLHWSKVHWVSGSRQRFKTLPGVSFDVTEEKLEELLADGRIDALVAPRTADEARPPAEQRLRALLPDPRRDEEDYLEKSGIYPINHVTVLRQDVIDRLPDAPRSLYEAYIDCKEAAFKRRLGTTLVPWGKAYWAEMFRKFDGDPLPYGLTPGNRKVIGKLTEFLHDQKLISAVPDIESLFPVAME